MHVALITIKFEYVRIEVKMKGVSFYSEILFSHMLRTYYVKLRQ